MAATTLRERIAAAQRTDPAQVEDSVLPRITTVAAVVIALVAVALTDAAPRGEVAASIALVIAGNVLSHRRRRADNTWIKVALAIVTVVVLGRFFTDLGLSQTIDDARQPLASLFLGVQTLHAFDLPRTRDLTFTVSASMALIALASAAATSGLFLVLVGIWLLLAGTSLWLLRLGENHRRGGSVLAREHVVAPRTQPRTDGGVRASSVVALGLATLLVFLAVPRPETGRTVSLPFEQLRQGVPSPGGVTNPGLPTREPGTSADPDDNFDATAYFGLADTVDIRTAGRLSDQLVLRVRSSRPRLLRGMVFDTYRDNRWTRTAEEPQPQQGLPVRLDAQPGPRHQLTQIIEVVTSTPNLIFAAGAPLDLYHAGQSAQQWSDGTVTVAATQEAGTIYSVISDVPVGTEASMRAAVGPTPADAATWLQVPELSDRTVALSAELVDPTRSNYANAESVMAWMADNVAYSLDLDDHPPDVDAVDALLFERRLGWCEPISASMVMLLRQGGVPARWVTGFMPGDFNVFSGYWEVRAKHAHAWVEVWVPGHGWIAFDPTGAVPTADGPATASVSVPLLALARDVLAWLRSLSLLGWLALLGALTVASLVGVRLRRRQVENAPFASLPVTWEPWETPTDLATRLARDHDVAREPLDVLVRTHHAHQLSEDPPPGPAVRQARAQVRRELRNARL